jgi:hypothetical protein
MTEHSIWAAAPPWEPTAHADGDPSIRTATACYATTTTWYVPGAKLRAPADSGLGLVTLSVYITPNGVLPDLATEPAASAQVEVGPAAGTYEARWDGPPPEVVAPNAIWTCLESESGQGYLFVGSGTVGSDFIQADDGADLYLAEAGHPRSALRIGSGGTGSSPAWYGAVPIVSDTPAEPTPSGGSVATVAVDAVGAGYARHSGGSAPSVAVDAVGQGYKRARGGSAAVLSVDAVGSGYNPADVPTALPTTGTLTPIITARGMEPTTPARRLEAV